MSDKKNSKARNGTTTGGFSLSHGELQCPPVHIPDETGGAYKTELVISRSKNKTEKILWWHGDDPRPTPHNHPWDFTSQILSGGYTEHKFWITKGGKLKQQTKTYKEGDLNIVKKNQYHVVVDVLPNTVTRLTCGKATEGNKWGYFDVDEMEYYDAEKDPKFIEEIQKINPHLRSK